MKNRIKELLRTTAVKLSLKYSLIYIFIFGMVFLFIYWFISAFVQDQIKASLVQESKRIEKIYFDKGFKAVEHYITSHQQYKGEDHRYYLLINSKGKIIAGDLKKWPDNLKIDKNIHNIWIAEKNIKGKVADGDGYWPMIAFKLPNGYKMLIAQGIKGTEDLRETMFTIMALMFGIVVLLTVVLGFSLGRKVLWHIDNINSAYENIMNGDLTSRIETSLRNDEFDKIGKQLNEMLDKIEELIKNSKNTLNNIAHDLRTPLNRIRNRLEIGIMDADKNCDELLEKTIKDIDNIIKTFNEILQIAQAESEIAKKSWENININEMILSIADLYLPLAENKSIKLNVSIPNEPVFIKGNKNLLIQAISNIADNAIKYTQENGLINIIVKYNSAAITISICDNGCGVSKKDYENITKPFVRLDYSRHTDGNGLGLSLVKAVVGLHKAELVFKDNNPGLCVELIFIISHSTT